MNGWLSPRGRFYKYEAPERANKHELFIGTPNPEDLVEELHWIRITPKYLLGTKELQSVVVLNITQKQIDFLLALVNSNDCTGDYKRMFRELMKEIDKQ